MAHTVDRAMQHNSTIYLRGWTPTVRPPLAYTSTTEQAARLASVRVERRIGRQLSRRVKLKFRRSGASRGRPPETLKFRLAVPTRATWIY
jgi:hypothetical protein